MSEFGIVYTLSIGTEKRHILEAIVTEVPEDVKPAAITEGLQGSALAADFSEHGFFFANRKVMAIDKLPKGTETGNPKMVPWKVLSGTGSRQVNLRIPGREVSAWEMAAGRAGLERNAWIRQTLNLAAGVDTPSS